LKTFDAEGKLRESRGYDVNIGLAFLAKGTLALDYRTKTGFWRKVAPVVFPNRLPKIIVELNNFVVVAVNTTDANSMFRPGDKIVEIDGISLGQDSKSPVNIDSEKVHRFRVLRDSKMVEFDSKFIAF
jgi:hypothetical protein